MKRAAGRDDAIADVHALEHLDRIAHDRAELDGALREATVVTLDRYVDDVPVTDCLNRLARHHDSPLHAVTSPPSSASRFHDSGVTLHFTARSSGLLLHLPPTCARGLPSDLTPSLGRELRRASSAPLWPAGLPTA